MTSSLNPTGSSLSLRSRARGGRLSGLALLVGALLPLPGLSVAPAAAMEASGNATIQCGAFTGAPQTDGPWTHAFPFSISGQRISFRTPVKGEVNRWSGTIDSAGHMVLTGEGSGGGGAWVMSFTGTWQGLGSTRLEGGYHNTRGLSGHRDCSMLF